ncbi:type IV pilus modification protein PilV [Leeia aquatica]|uniref:Type IV pilus modification protein PilV n=1 Tax=Leeia aquatica TaxID=2725557 RepID=A0A847SFI0_9NEIS|nr:type IV pilus modification protein PilV [Leeia aquatica]NLR74712.1 type IV pilus modification protein PilV [Leeia aquatica]
MLSARHLHRPPVSRQSGVTILEVMVSILILAVGILGLAGAQTRALNSARNAYEQGIAADVVNSLADSIRANRSPIVAQSGVTTGPTLPDYTTPITGNALAASDYTQALNDARNQLAPTANIVITRTATADNYGRYTVTMTWSNNIASQSYAAVVE